MYLCNSVLTDIFLPGAYPRPLDPTAYPLPYPYNMAIAKGSSFDSESGSALKKPRTVFSPKQLLHLEEEFVKNQFPNMEQRKQIAKDLDLTQQHIQVGGHCLLAILSQSISIIMCEGVVDYNSYVYTCTYYCM